jgi:hypothetical protein
MSLLLYLDMEPLSNNSPAADTCGSDSSDWLHTEQSREACRTGTERGDSGTFTLSHAVESSPAIDSLILEDIALSA